jgi:hypothetical protein
MASPLRFIGAFLLSCTLACAPIAPESGPSCGTIFYSREIEVSWADTLDLVLVVDNTPGMERAQQTLMRTLPRVLEQLLTGDRDGDGVAEQAAIRSIHLGVITTDMGTGPGYANSFDGCHTPGGDDGLVGASINAAVAPSFLTFASTDATGGLAAQSQRALDVGTRGCVFRQPLEAALKAITSAEETDWYGEDNPRFRDPRTGARTDPGHASSAHAGFFRRDAALGIVVMTNGDDCSAGDERIFMDTEELIEECIALVTVPQRGLVPKQRRDDASGLNIRVVPIHAGMLREICSHAEHRGDRRHRSNVGAAAFAQVPKHRARNYVHIGRLDHPRHEPKERGSLGVVLWKRRLRVALETMNQCRNLSELCGRLMRTEGAKHVWQRTHRSLRARRVLRALRAGLTTAASAHDECDREGKEAR